jgi:NAD(P) transhydrogenase
MDTPSKKYDLIVIGTGPAGEKAAVKAAYFGHKVAIIEKESYFGGAEVTTGTLPSKTLRETALFFSGKYEKGLYGVERNLKRAASVEDFMFHKNLVSKAAGKEVEDNLVRHGVEIYHGTATFENAHTIRVGDTLLIGDYIIIATGSYPYHPATIPFDGNRVHDSDTILQIKRFPTSVCVVGAGVIGCEYATIFSTMGAKVFLINDKDKILPHVDNEITKALLEEMKASGIEILFNTSIASVTCPKDETAPIDVELKSGEHIKTDMFLFAAGRSGQTKALDCEKLGIKFGKRETIEVDHAYRTSVPHVYAVGDVIGFPSLASTGMDQGRVAVAYIFKTEDLTTIARTLPLAIYTVPEVSMVGLTEEAAQATSLAYCTGKARYTDMDRGRIMGVTSGFLKLIFNRSDLTICGVHIIGNMASELIHYGIILVEEKKTLYNVIRQVFNYPTLHDLYKYAAYDGLSNLSGHKIKE